MNSNFKIQIHSLSKSFGNSIILNGINLNIKKGSSLVVLGESGSGKSVFIKSMVGLIKPDEGSIIVNGVETINLSSSERLKVLGKWAFLFQGGALFDSLTIKENVIFFAKRLYDLTQKELLDLAISKLSLVGLSESILNFYPSELSGGMQKRVSLARAICVNPELIFFDEPTSGLDPIMSNMISRLILKIRVELGATTVTITHDLNSACIIATDLALLHQGKIVWLGNKDEMKTSNNSYLNRFTKAFNS